MTTDNPNGYEENEVQFEELPEYEPSSAYKNSSTNNNTSANHQQENTANLSGRIGQPSTTSSSATAANRSGGVGVVSSGSLPGGYHENTLDESITTTILRDFKKVWHKTIQVLVPKGRENALREWDLWGPMLMCLSLAIIMSSLAPEKQASTVFTGIFVIICFGSSIVTLNCKLLGGNVSFFQSVCTLGYCVFPLVVSSLVALLVHNILVTVVVVVVATAWSIYASIGFLAGSHLMNRRLLAVYPIFLFYISIGWIIIISS